MTNYKNEIFVVLLSTVLSREPICSLLSSLIISNHDSFLEFFISFLIAYLTGMSVHYIFSALLTLLQVPILKNHYPKIKLVLLLAVCIAQYFVEILNIVYLGLLVLELIMFSTALKHMPHVLFKDDLTVNLPPPSTQFNSILTFIVIFMLSPLLLFLPVEFLALVSWVFWS